MLANPLSSTRFPAVTDKIRWFEIIAIALTGVLKFIFMNGLGWKLPFIVIAIVFWTGYVLFRVWQDHRILRYWGFTTRFFNKSFTTISIYAGIAVIGFALYGYFSGKWITNWHLLVILLAYPIWGVIQQYLMMSLVAGNLKDMRSTALPNWAIYLITATLFCSVHLPYPILTAGTFLLALFYSWIFLNYRNLWPLGIYHGILGGLFYFWVLGRDPWLEVIEAGF